MDTFSFRWGISWLDSAKKGSASIPGFIMRNYHKLGVKPVEMMCITHIAAYHYECTNGTAQPSLTRIAEEMGYAKPDSVSRLVKRLENAGLLLVERREGQTSIYDASPLAQQCLRLEIGEVAVEQAEADTGVPTNTPPPNLGVPPKRGDEDKEIYIFGDLKITVPGGTANPDHYVMQHLLVEKVFGGNWAQASWAGGIANMLLGLSDKPQFKDYNFEHPVNPDELWSFIQHWMKKGIDFPTDPKKINKHVFLFRRDGGENGPLLTLGPEPVSEPSPPPPLPKPRFISDGTPYRESVAL